MSEDVLIEAPKMPVTYAKEPFFWYVPKAYRKFAKEWQPRFKIKIFSQEFMRDVKDNEWRSTVKGRKSISTIRTGTKEKVAYEEGVIGWELYLETDTEGRVLTNGSGSPIEIPFNHENKARILPWLREELAQAALGASSLTEEEEENLE